MKIEIRNLKKHFGETRAVDDISFSFDSGKIVGFVGPNGAGKTTTMRILATIEEPTDGDVFMDDVSITEYPEHARRIVGFVPDSLPEYSDMTIHEYLDFFARAYGLNGKNLKLSVQGVEEFTKLCDLREKHVKSLSKGMKQRLSLSRALIHNPDVLVLDEPAAGLDPRARVELRELLAILAQQNKAILISSHILTELTEICHGVVIIEKGKLLEHGSIREVSERGVQKRTVVIRPLERYDDLYRSLLEMAFVKEAKKTGNEILVEVDGNEETCANLLDDLIRKGFRMVEFRQKQRDLEDIFMSVTKGDVQ